MYFPDIPFVLGSKSPRRQALLSELGIEFELRSADADESFPKDLSGREVPVFLADMKAAHIPIKDEECLITADTVVEVDNSILNKPGDEEEAFSMLSRLSGRSHWVHTGVCLRQMEKKKLFVESTRVFFRELSEEEIYYYIQNYQPFDKAGAYGIQEWIGHTAVERIEGCYLNVVGFPLPRLVRELKVFFSEN
ncbi:MAG: septum formation protein Maf [Bacteroidetes bacterium]|nr:septum formation protein Maf [Bacteroidota bacterium]